jgi:hypothetical protein
MAARQQFQLNNISKSDATACVTLRCASFRQKPESIIFRQMYIPGQARNDVGRDFLRRHQLLT